LKRIIYISLFTLTIIGLLTLTGFIVNYNKSNQVSDIEVNIYRNSELGFLNSGEILHELNRIKNLPLNPEVVDSLIINKLETDKIENVLTNNPYIDEVDSYFTVDGRLLINIKEKEPIIRIYDSGNEGFYIDNNGDIFPISRQFAPRVIIANGYIKDKITNFNSNITDSIYSSSFLQELFYLTQLINQNELLKAQINQIYVNSKGEYDLIPELGNHLVQFGTFDNAQIKLRNLDAYYRKSLKTDDWDIYKTINLTYKDQIVCTKK
jgi:cell division protein FtsQ|tara:strand:+ start:119 stop:913 length:795 start_codon:yes stop_codon:yes gene_type:complete